MGESVSYKQKCGNPNSFFQEKQDWFIMMNHPDYCQCEDFKRAVDCQDIVYCKPEDDRSGVVKKPGWYIYAWGYHAPVVSLEP
jgi:hypothetical protein